MIIVGRMGRSVCSIVPRWGGGGGGGGDDERLGGHLSGVVS